MVDRVGQQLGSYKIEQFLDQGGFGEVYLGEHVHLGTQAAIKILKTQIIREEVGAFQNEARTIARLIHPHIIRVLEYNVEVQTGTPFFVMDYAANGTLRKRHPKGAQVPLADIVSYVNQIAQALQYAHTNRIIHRDIKPENMLVGQNGEILLSDFGIALIAQSSRYQGTQDMVGTIGYMAPEQIQGHPLPASDQYALGIVVYEWLCGKRPFDGSFPEIAAQHYKASPPSLKARTLGLPPQVEQVVMRALAKDPQQRFASIQEFAQALEQASGIIPVTPNVRSGNADPEAFVIKIGKPTRKSIIASLVGSIIYAFVVSRLYPDSFAHFLSAVNSNGYFAGYSVGDMMPLLSAVGGIVLFGFFEAIPLFFSAAFGPYVGVLVGGIGFFIGTYYGIDFYNIHSTQSINYLDFLNHWGGHWYLALSIILACFLMGFVYRQSRGNYDTSEKLSIAYAYAIGCIIVSTLFVILTFDRFITDSSSFEPHQLFLLVFVLPGSLLVPLLLKAYTVVTKSLRPNGQRSTVFAR